MNHVLEVVSDQSDFMIICRVIVKKSLGRSQATQGTQTYMLWTEQIHAKTDISISLTIHVAEDLGRWRNEVRKKPVY